jgi:small GTP-binding protein
MANSPAQGSTVSHGRIVAIGDCAVSKTSIINYLVQGRMNIDEPSTVGANWQPYVHEFNSDRIELQIWDTAGQERFRSLGPLYYRNAVGAFVVYDITNRSSFDNLKLWITDFKTHGRPDARIMIVANKCDLHEERQVTIQQGLNWAREQEYQIYEPSAKTGENVRPLFEAMAESVSCMEKSKQSTISRPDERKLGGRCC